jgi:hypothetical protein
MKCDEGQVKEIAGSDENVSERRWHGHVVPVGLMAATVVLCGALWAFFVDLVLILDDLGLFNPIYMYVATGKMSYPAYGFSEAMLVHPPTHYFVLGLLVKLGVPITYAGSVPPFTLIVLTVVLLCRSSFMPWVKIGFLFGLLYGAISVAWAFGPTSFGIRPDLHLALAWFAGLVALETARVGGWNLGRLCLGSFLITYAAGIHYPAGVAWIGVLIYAACAFLELRWPGARDPVVALVVGGCLFGVPYLAFFLLPHWESIVAFVASVDATGGLRESWSQHVTVYRSVSRQVGNDVVQSIIFWPVSAGIPVALICVPLLLMLRQTRALALASLGLLGPMLLMVQRKLGTQYLYPEFMLYASALATFLALGLAWSVRRMSPQREALAAAFPAVVLAGVLMVTVIRVGAASIRLTPRVDEMAIARAAGRQILGPNALVGARLTRFYTNGGHIHYRVDPDLLWTQVLPRDLTAYFLEFDAIAEDAFLSELTTNQAGESLSSWYAHGVLNVRGFYFSPSSTHLSYLLLQPTRVPKIEGYALLRNGQMAQLTYDPDGQYVFAAAICSPGAFSLHTNALLARNVHLLPSRGGRSSHDELHVFVARRDESSAFQGALESCRVRDRVPLRLEELGVEQLLASLRDDTLIQFPQSLPEALRLRHGPQLEVNIGGDQWPKAFVYYPRRGEGQRYVVGTDDMRILLHFDIVTSRELQVSRYGRGGGLEGEADCFDIGDPCGKYESGSSRDHLATAFLDTRGIVGHPIFFAAWAKPLGGAAPSIALQDSGFQKVAVGSPIVTRSDGWMLYAGVWEEVRSTAVRLLIMQPAGTACLIDKLLIAEVMKQLPRP